MGWRWVTIAGRMKIKMPSFCKGTKNLNRGSRGFHGYERGLIASSKSVQFAKPAVQSFVWLVGAKRQHGESYETRRVKIFAGSAKPEGLFQGNRLTFFRVIRVFRGDSLVAADDAVTLPGISPQGNE